ncbi:MAG TPA: alpha/beta fold hydrolase [Thermoplasmata archaeon]|nr:alpha/beta fold hydrolase [Thermoplasmata archaeon]
MPEVVNDGVRIHYETEGVGPAVVLVTGAGGDVRMWRDAGYVAGLVGFRSILIERRGRGRSDRPRDVEQHRIPRFVGDVACVLDDLGVEAAGFWGYSSGVFVGIAFGAAHPDRLKVLVGTGSLSNLDFDRLPPLDPEQWIAEDIAAGGVRVELDRYLKEDHDRFPEVIDRNVREGDPLMHALDRLAWRSWHGPKSVYSALRSPLLMITGANEDREGETERTVPALRDARVVRLPGQSHLGTFYRSDLALPHVLPFLRQHLR